MWKKKLKIEERSQMRGCKRTGEIEKVGLSHTQKEREKERIKKGRRVKEGFEKETTAAWVMKRKRGRKGKPKGKEHLREGMDRASVTRGREK